VLNRYYLKETLASDLARQLFVMPDRRKGVEIMAIDPERPLNKAEARFREGKPFIFFASRMPGMESLRNEVHQFGNDREIPVWLAGYSNPELNDRPLEEVQIACMDRVRKAEKFICVLNGAYGAPLEVTELCILELEIFAAVVSQRDISVLLLEPFVLDEHLQGLLKMLSAACPQAIDLKPKPEKEVCEIVASLCEGRPLPARSGKKTSVFGHLLQFLGRERTGRYSPQGLDVSFLNGEFVPLPAGSFGGDQIERLLKISDEQERAPDRLAYLWTAVRHLSAIPYDQPEFAPLWHRALRRWASAAAWYGIHGHFLLGRLAAVNTILGVQAQLPGGDDGEMAIQGTYGAIASEYYSIAKQVPSWRDRRELLHRALKNADEALKRGQPDSSGLLAIRGSVHLKLGHVRMAVEDYEKSLKLRSGEEPGRIGEAQVELALGYLFAGRPWRVRPLLEEGIRNLRESNRHEFLVRALRKLGLFEALLSRRQRSREAFHEALEIAECRDWQGQIRQIRSEMKRLRFEPPPHRD
jgi:tetratricopeptide (TPR) repeat protein